MTLEVSDLATFDEAQIGRQACVTVLTRIPRQQITGNNFSDCLSILAACTAAQQLDRSQGSKVNLCAEFL